MVILRATGDPMRQDGHYSDHPSHYVSKQLEIGFFWFLSKTSIARFGQCKFKHDQIVMEKFCYGMKIMLHENVSGLNFD